MRYQQLQRSPTHRRAMMRNLAQSLIQHESITTTLARARSVQPYVDRIIGLAKRAAAQDEYTLSRMMMTAALPTKTTATTTTANTATVTDVVHNQKLSDPSRSTVSANLSSISPSEKDFKNKAQKLRARKEMLARIGQPLKGSARAKVQAAFYQPPQFVPKIFGPLLNRYQARKGGFTRILEIEPVKEDQARSAIIELVDGPCDMRFALTAKALAYSLRTKTPISFKTAANVGKVIMYRRAQTNSSEVAKQDAISISSTSSSVKSSENRAVSSHGPEFELEHLARQLADFEDELEQDHEIVHSQMNVGNLEQCLSTDSAVSGSPYFPHHSAGAKIPTSLQDILIRRSELKKSVYPPAPRPDRIKRAIQKKVGRVARRADRDISRFKKMLASSKDDPDDSGDDPVARSDNLVTQA